MRTNTLRAGRGKRRGRLTALAACASALALVGGLVMAVPAAAAPTVVTINVGDRPNGVAVGDGSVYVTNYGGGTVSVISQATNTVTATINVGGGPYGVAVGDGNVYVTNFWDDTVTVIDQSSNTVTETITVGGGPWGVAASASDVYVTNFDDKTVSVIDQNSGTVTGTIDVGDGPIDVAVGSGHVYVANHRDDTVSVIDQSSGTVVDVINVGRGPRGVAVDDGQVYVANEYGTTMSVINQATNKVTRTVYTGAGSRGVAASAGQVYVTNFSSDMVLVSDRNSGGVIDVGDGPTGVAVDGRHVYVTNYNAGTVSVFGLFGGSFTDVAADSTFGLEIYALVHNDVINGFGDYTFRPKQKVTRGQFAAFAARTMNKLDGSLNLGDGSCASGSPFTDVGKDSTFCAQIAWLADQGVTKGYDDDTFRPGQNISRAQIAAFLYRLDRVIHGAAVSDAAATDTEFPDVTASNAFSGEIQWLADQNVTGGTKDGNFNPGANTPRQQTAAFFYRFGSLEKVGLWG